MRKLLLGALTLALACGPAGAAEVSDLIAQLGDPSNDVRRAAAKELGEAGPAARAGDSPSRYGSR